MGVTAFIPAKMTSRRLHGKNMRLLSAKPLIYYSIRAAQSSKNINDVVVSSSVRFLIIEIVNYLLQILRIMKLCGLGISHYQQNLI